MQLNEQITKKAFFIFFLAASFYLYEFIMQVAPGVMSQALMHDLQINATTLGVMSGSFYYSYTFMQFPGGMLLDRYGARIILTTVTGTFAIGVLLFGLAPNIVTATMARFIMGGAGAFAFTGVLHLALRWFPTKYYAILTGTTEMMGSLGAIGGSIPLALMLNYYSWRQVSIIFGIAGLCLAALIYFLVRDFVNPANTQTKIPTPTIPMLQKAKIVLSRPQNWFIGLYSFSVWAPVLGFSALWGVSFLESSCHISIVAAAKAISFSWLGVALGSPLVGWLSELIKRRCLVLAIAALSGFLALTSAIIFQNIPIPLLYSLMFLIGFGASGQTLAFAVVKDNNQHAVCSTANGLNNMIIVSGGMLMQPLIGKLLDLNWHGIITNGVRIYDLASYRIAFLILPICYLIAFFTSLFLIKETHCENVCKSTTQF